MSSVMSDQALIRTTSWGVIGGIVLTLFLILLGNINAGDVNERQRVDRNTPCSYTHQTLPTNYSVEIAVVARP